MIIVTVLINNAKISVNTMCHHGWACPEESEISESHQLFTLLPTELRSRRLLGITRWLMGKLPSLFSLQPRPDFEATITV